VKKYTMVIPVEDERTKMQNYGCEMGVEE